MLVNTIWLAAWVEVILLVCFAAAGIYYCVRASFVWVDNRRYEHKMKRNRVAFDCYQAKELLADFESHLTRPTWEDVRNSYRDQLEVFLKKCRKDGMV